MPAYNEAGNIEGAIADVIDQVFAVVPQAELLVIDDGSRDRTGELVAACAVRDPRIVLVQQANAGHGPALLNGLRAARGEYCLLLDSDRQISLGDFAQTWRLVAEYDAVLGIRRQRQDPPHRLLLSAGLRRAMKLFLGIGAADPNVPYKLVRRAPLTAAIDCMPPSPRIPSILLTVYLTRHGYRIAQQPVVHFPRMAGATTLRFARLSRFCALAGVELLRFAAQVRRPAPDA